MSPERSLASYAAAVLSLAFQALDRGVSLRDATCTLCEDGLTVLLEVPVGDDESIGAAFQLPTGSMRQILMLGRTWLDSGMIEKRN
jgi:hypothetical protein